MPAPDKTLPDTAPPPSLDDLMKATVAEMAYALYEYRTKEGKPGTAETDWIEAQNLHTIIQDAAATQEKEQVLPPLPEDNDPAAINDFFKSRRISFIPGLSIGTHKLAVNAGCCASVMSALTGEHPMYIKARQIEAGIPDDEIVEYLRANKFEVTKLTESVLKPAAGVMTRYVSSTNVILAKLSVAKGEASWVLLWEGHMIHNWDRTPIDSMTFVNHVILEMYLIWNPVWESDNQVMQKIRMSKGKSNTRPDRRTLKDVNLEFRDLGLAASLFGSFEGHTYVE